jgi:hypothetical protein
VHAQVLGVRLPGAGDVYVDAIEGSIPIGIELGLHPKVVLNPVLGFREGVDDLSLTVDELLLGLAAPLCKCIGGGETKGSGENETESFA